VSDFILDTNVLIRCLRGISETLDLARTLTEEGDLHISVLSQLEVLTLAQPQEEKRTLDFLTPFILHPVNELIAHRAATLLKSAGPARPLYFSEAIIAATALQHGLVLVTYGPGNLQRVSELKLYPLPAASISRGMT